MTHDRFPSPFNRRDLLRLGLTAGAASLVTACGWQGGPLMPALQGASRLNDWVGEKSFLFRPPLAPQDPPSARTPEGLFPAYSISHPLPQLTDPSGWALEVGGLVRRPARRTLAVIRAMPKVRYTVKPHCVEGWSAIATWTGASLASIVNMVEPRPAA